MTTTTTSLVCPKCGTIGKSGKTSCCGRGGSWFRKCRSADSRNFRHTWSEGILVCKTQSQLKKVRSRQSNGAQQLNSSYGIGMGGSQAVITAAETFTLTSANISTRILTSNVSTTTFDNNATMYNTGTTHSKAITTTITASDHVSITTSSDKSVSDSSSVVSTTAPTTTTVTTTVPITSTTMITHTDKPAIMVSNWISQGMFHHARAVFMIIIMRIDVFMHDCTQI